MYRLDLLENTMWPTENGVQGWIIIRDDDNECGHQNRLMKADQPDIPYERWVFRPEIHDWLIEQGVVQYNILFSVEQDETWNQYLYSCWLETDKDVRLLFKLTWSRPS